MVEVLPNTFVFVQSSAAKDWLYADIDDKNLGKVFVVFSQSSIGFLGFTDALGVEACLTEAREYLGQTDFQQDNQKGQQLLAAMTDPEQVFESGLYLAGTDFQMQVWAELLNIACAQISSYQGIAEMISRPNAARAVGTAIGKNPVSLLVPCHRVLNKTGKPGGYRWGLHAKQKLLAWESAISGQLYQDNGGELEFE